MRYLPRVAGVVACSCAACGVFAMVCAILDSCNFDAGMMRMLRSTRQRNSEGQGSDTASVPRRLTGGNATNCTNGSNTTNCTNATVTQLLPPLEYYGFITADQGAESLPPVVSRTTQYSPLAQTTLSKQLNFIAGLRYRLELHSITPLGMDINRAFLKLMYNVTHWDADCDKFTQVTNFAGEFSILDGKGAAHEALIRKNVWLEARVPYSGLYGLCYTPNGSITWRAVPGLSIQSYGTSEAETKFWCVAELNQSCIMTVHFPQPSSRLMLLELSGRCGYNGGDVTPQPFQQRTTTVNVTRGVADHTLGQYVKVPTGTAPEPQTLRLCFCFAYEFNVFADGNGPCLSSGATDFPQSLGFLYLSGVSSDPANVYPGLRFTAKVMCGKAGSGGCHANVDVRIRFIDMAPDATFGLGGVFDICRSYDESALYVGPPNCAGKDMTKCSLHPTVASQDLPSWYFIRLRGQTFNKLTRAQRLGVCYCDGVACHRKDYWFRVGSVVVNPILVFPDPIVMGLPTTLRLSAPGGSWTTGVGSGSQVLKFIYDPNVRIMHENCSTARQVPGTLRYYECSFATECPQPNATSSSGPSWTNILAIRAGYYAVCYCDFECQFPDRWNVLKWHLVAGPEKMIAGSVSQGLSVFTGRAVELILFGQGLSSADRLIFLHHEGACGTLGAISSATNNLFFKESVVPTLASAPMAGVITSIQPEFDGTRIVMVVAHGLSIGDTIHLSNVTVAPNGVICKPVYSMSLGKTWSHCVEALTAYQSHIVRIPSLTQVVIDVKMTAAECQVVDVSGALWHRTSRETFSSVYASRGSQGRYRVCWGQSPASIIDFTADAGVMTVSRPPSFRSAVHLTTIAPGVVAPSIIAFELGNSPKYSTSVGPMSLLIGFRNSSRFRHSFRSSRAGMPVEVTREQATLSACGRLFRELWSSSEDGFPQPQGCFYKESYDEYGILFSPKAGFRPGSRYQIVMWTFVAGSLVSEHDWRDIQFALPVLPFAPNEIRHTAPSTFGDVGPVSNTLSCKEACSRSIRCNVAIFHTNTDRHCLIGDFSDRKDPYAVKNTSVGDGDLTMFMVDRLNRSNLALRYYGPLTGATDVAVDLWSMDDMFTHPFEVIEESEGIIEDTAGLQPTAVDPRWHLYDGFKVIDTSAASNTAVNGGPLLLNPESPLLTLRLRAAAGSPIQPGAAIRIFFWPLTQWQLPPDCLVECTAHSSLLRCARPTCAAMPIAHTIWFGSRNKLQIVLSNDMTPITDTVMHTLSIRGRYLRLPETGFMPTQLAAEVQGGSTFGDFQPPIDYTLTTGFFPYVALGAITSILALDENAKPFASDVSNVLYARLQLGSMLHAGSSTSTSLALELPPGYSCLAATTAPTNLTTFSSLGIRPQGRGQLNASGTWSFSSSRCTYTMVPYSVVYGGSAIAVKLTVNNPAKPMGATDTANQWYVRVAGNGDASSSLSLTALPNVGRQISYPSAFLNTVAVLGKLTQTSVTPTNFWWAASNNVLRIFFRTVQSSGALPALIELRVPEGFGFYEYCFAEDLPDLHYAPLQGPYTSLTFPITRLGPRRCRAAFVPGAVDKLPTVLTIATTYPIAAETVYGFSTRIFHPNVFNQSQRTSFVMTTYAGDTDNPLDRSPQSVPMLVATESDAFPSYGIYRFAPKSDIFQVQLSDLMPYQLSQLSATVNVRLLPPLDATSSDPYVRQYSKLVSWRLFAPLGYAWRFTDATFRTRIQDGVAGITKDLPIARKPTAPLFPPTNIIIFHGYNENLIGFEANHVYGFDTFINVPPDTPRSGVNEWIIQFRYDGQNLSQRVTAASLAGGEVRAVHSFYVRSLVTKLMGASTNLMFQFVTITAIPVQQGALVVEAPTGFVFQAACAPYKPSGKFVPYSSVTDVAQLDCTAATLQSLHQQGILRPRVTLRSLNVDIQAGKWVFALSCINPSSVFVSRFSVDTFVLHTFINHATNVVADVPATATGYTVMSGMASATIVNSVSYFLSGRDDHPGQASNVIISFETRAAPIDSGSTVIEVLAPPGFEFQYYCTMTIGDGVFGMGQPYPAPYEPFPVGVKVISCTGYQQFAVAQVTPGLLQGTKYAFSIRVDLQPELTPSTHEWRVSVGREQSSAITGFDLWTFSGMSVAMSDISRHDPNAQKQNLVDIVFVPTNTITVKGMLVVLAPTDFEIRFDCTVEIWQLDSTRTIKSAMVPATVCKGEQPATNLAEIRFQSEHSAIVRGFPYRLSFLVKNPSTIPMFVGRWTLWSYETATTNPDWSVLKDIGRVLSLQITDYFKLFTVSNPPNSNLQSLRLTLQFEFALPGQTFEWVTIRAPTGYNFAVAVADPLLANDFRSCISFVDSGVDPLPVPLCAGVAIRFDFRVALGLGATFRFQAVSEWPRTTVTTLQSKFHAEHTKMASQSTMYSTSVADLTPVTPRLLGFQFSKVGARADAVSSNGTVQIMFTTSQAAQAVSISTNVQGLLFTSGIRFNNATVEVNSAGQVLKLVRVVRDGTTRLVLAFDLSAGQQYILIIRNVQNPDVICTVLWSVQTYIKPKPPGTLATPAQGQNNVATTVPPTTTTQPPHVSTDQEVLSWLINDNLRDEMLGVPAPATVGRVILDAAQAVLDSSFFDFSNTRATFGFSVMPSKIPSGSRLLVFAPDDWTFVPASFAASTNMPAFNDFGILQCIDTASQRSRLIYVVQILGDIRPSSPCLFNPSQICVYSSKFSLRVNTPRTPNDLTRWWADSDQSWLVLVDSLTTNNCGTISGQLDPGLMTFSNDALFSGFSLKESLGKMKVIPEPAGQLSRQKISIAVTFESGSALQITQQQVSQGLSIFLRLKTVLGLEFEVGCLSAVPDPDYSSCIGSMDLAVVRVRERVLPSGEHRVVVQAVNPYVTPFDNMWILETYVGVTYAQAKAGLFQNVRQRGSAPGYTILQTLVAHLNPATTQRSTNTYIFIWFRPGVYVQPLGVMELHAGQGFVISCEPSLLLISMPSVSCRSYLGTSGAQFSDLHYILEFQISSGTQLLPNEAYELAINARNPDAVPPPATGTSNHWGLRLRNAQRVVLEANMTMGYYNLTDYGMTLVSITPSTSERYAKNEVRLILDFKLAISLTFIATIRIMAPIGWDFRPLCQRYEDVTGGKNQKSLQLPYADEKGHHSCPKANVLLLFLDQTLTIQARIYTLLIGVMNAGTVPKENFWKVGLLSPPFLVGWTPSSANTTHGQLSADGLRAGQQVVVESWTMGFAVGERQGPSRTPEPTPLAGVFTELLSGRATPAPISVCSVVSMFALVFARHEY